ncbi:MAG TPA: transposase [Cyclobacteriaceae bacterium]|nr:transposase [Cyclobacteriaceae bacterium]
MERLIHPLIGLYSLPLQAPDYTTFSWRAAELSVMIQRQAYTEPQPIVINSSGLKVYGDGE